MSSLPSWPRKCASACGDGMVDRSGLRCLWAAGSGSPGRTPRRHLRKALVTGNRRCRAHKFGRDGAQGRAVAVPMAEQPDVIFAYTDQQALDDGVLVAVSGESGVNRVTRAAFDHFAKLMGETPITGAVIYITP